MNRSIDGFVELADYAVLSDGRTSALLALDGQIDWWALPAMDDLPLCGALLDPAHGGHVFVRPENYVAVERRYVPSTNVLETTFVTGAGTVVVTSALNTGASGRLPWTELVFSAAALGRPIRMIWEFRPGNHLGVSIPRVAMVEGVPIVNVGDHNIALIVATSGSFEVLADRVRGEFMADAHQSSLIAFTGTKGVPAVVPAPEDVAHRLENTKEAWRRWSSHVSDCGEWSPCVARSALALKALVAERSGAIAAAVTTSLPERIGGPKNWDYRFAWVRDSSFSIDALLNMGLSEEVHNSVAFLVRSVRQNGPDMHVFFTLDGEIEIGERELDLPGYQFSRPVRTGNDATSQLQLGNYGDFFDTLHRYASAGHVLDALTQSLLVDMAEQCRQRWRDRDSGIWELHELRDYTISKIGCWVAFDRAVQLVECGQLPNSLVNEWRAARDEIREFIETRCWSHAKQTYTLCADSEELDAAVLLAARTGFDRGERLRSTIEAINNELGDGVLIYRYTNACKEEGAFVACTFWMVEALAYSDQRHRARDMMSKAVELVNDVGILSEQIDPECGAFLGNLPQGLSHLALINAAFTLLRAE
ncbi:MAG: glycoside hydrolase family 15 protein [Acidimicrobiales bacterium]